MKAKVWFFYAQSETRPRVVLLEGVHNLSQSPQWHTQGTRKPGVPMALPLLSSAGTSVGPAKGWCWQSSGLEDETTKNGWFSGSMLIYQRVYSIIFPISWIKHKSCRIPIFQHFCPVLSRFLALHIRFAVRPFNPLFHPWIIGETRNLRTSL